MFISCFFFICFSFPFKLVCSFLIGRRLSETLNNYWLLKWAIIEYFQVLVKVIKITVTFSLKIIFYYLHLKINLSVTEYYVLRHHLFKINFGHSFYLLKLRVTNIWILQYNINALGWENSRPFMVMMMSCEESILTWEWFCRKLQDFIQFSFFLIVF